MRETIRTIIIVVLIVVAIWFIYWIRTSSEETLRTIDQSVKFEKRLV